jgi:hypothetical protein
MPLPKEAKKLTTVRKAASEKIAPLAGRLEWIEPCLPTLVDRPPVGPKWRHEVKWDGYRLCVVVDRGSSTVRTRHGHDWTHRVKSIAAAAAGLLRQNAMIDGEAVVLDDRGHSNFSALQARLDGESRAEVALYAFDLLFIDGRDLRPLRLSERRAALEGLIGRPTSGAINLSEEFDTDGATFFKIAALRVWSRSVPTPRRETQPDRRLHGQGRNIEWREILLAHGSCSFTENLRRLTAILAVRIITRLLRGQPSATFVIASAKAWGASCGRLCPTPPLIARCSYLPTNFFA